MHQNSCIQSPTPLSLFVTLPSRLVHAKHPYSDLLPCIVPYLFSHTLQSEWVGLTNCRLNRQIYVNGLEIKISLLPHFHIKFMDWVENRIHSNFISYCITRLHHILLKMQVKFGFTWYGLFKVHFIGMNCHVGTDIIGSAAQEPEVTTPNIKCWQQVYKDSQHWGCEAVKKWWTFGHIVYLLKSYFWLPELDPNQNLLCSIGK